MCLYSHYVSIRAILTPCYCILVNDFILKKTICGSSFFLGHSKTETVIALFLSTLKVGKWWWQTKEDKKYTNNQSAKLAEMRLSCFQSPLVLDLPPLTGGWPSVQSQVCSKHWRWILIWAWLHYYVTAARQWKLNSNALSYTVMSFWVNSVHSDLILIHSITYAPRKITFSFSYYLY